MAIMIKFLIALAIVATVLSFSTLESFTALKIKLTGVSVTSIDASPKGPGTYYGPTKKFYSSSIISSQLSTPSSGSSFGKGPMGGKSSSAPVPAASSGTSFGKGPLGSSTKVTTPLASSSTTSFGKGPLGASTPKISSSTPASSATSFGKGPLGGKTSSPVSSPVRAAVAPVSVPETTTAASFGKGPMGGSKSSVSAARPVASYSAPQAKASPSGKFYGLSKPQKPPAASSYSAPASPVSAPKSYAPSSPSPASTSSSSVVSFGKGPLGGKSSSSPSAGRPVARELTSPATSAGGGKFYGFKKATPPSGRR